MCLSVRGRLEAVEELIGASTGGGWRRLRPTMTGALFEGPGPIPTDTIGRSPRGRAVGVT
jgi:hypothetical protein